MIDVLDVDGIDRKLFCVGNKSIIDTKCIAVVGSRRVTRYGKNVVKDLVPRLAKNGITIVSGLAVGVDELAHKETLSVGGSTVGLLGCGFKYLKRSVDSNLVREMVRSGNGLVISPFSHKTRYSKRTFVYRNEIMAWLCSGVLVIEASEGSGALLTAEFAMNQNKPIFAVPGSIFSKNSKGCHFLIKNGGILVESYETVLDVIRT